MIQPLQRKIAIDNDKREEESAGGVILPPDAQEATQTGVIAAVGSQCEDLKAGDRVLYPKHTGVEVFVDGEEVLMMDERDVIAVKVE